MTLLATRLFAAALAAAVAGGAVLGGQTVLWCEPMQRAVDRCCCDAPDETPAEGPVAERECCGEREIASLPEAPAARTAGADVPPAVLQRLNQ